MINAPFFGHVLHHFQRVIRSTPLI